MFCSTTIAEVGFAVQGLDSIVNVQGANCAQDNLSSDGAMVSYVILFGSNVIQHNESTAGEIGGGTINLLGDWASQINQSSNGAIVMTIGKWSFTSSDILQPWTVWNSE